MTYSIQVRAETRDECKRRIVSVLDVQLRGQPSHTLDRPHVERVLCAFVDTIAERPGYDIVADAYGYINSNQDVGPTSVVLNAKVYSVLRMGTAVASLPEVAGIAG